MYIRDYASDFFKSGGSQAEEEIKCTDEFLLQHPRYLNLIKGMEYSILSICIIMYCFSVKSKL